LSPNRGPVKSSSLSHKEEKSLDDEFVIWIGQAVGQRVNGRRVVSRPVLPGRLHGDLRGAHPVGHPREQVGDVDGEGQRGQEVGGGARHRTRHEPRRLRQVALDGARHGARWVQHQNLHRDETLLGHRRRLPASQKLTNCRVTSIINIFIVGFSARYMLHYIPAKGNFDEF